MLPLRPIIQLPPLSANCIKLHDEAHDASLEAFQRSHAHLPRFRRRFYIAPIARPPGR